MSGRSKLDSPHGPIGEASDWLDKTVNVPTVNSLALPEWMAEFERLKKVNAEIMGGKTGNSAAETKADEAPVKTTRKQRVDRR